MSLNASLLSPPPPRAPEREARSVAERTAGRLGPWGVLSRVCRWRGSLRSIPTRDARKGSLEGEIAAVLKEKPVSFQDYPGRE